jgi:hypothetical protein
MKHLVTELARQYQLLMAWDPPRAARKYPSTDDVTLAWIHNAEVYSALVHVTEVSEGRIGLWCSNLVPSGHTVLVASNDGTGSWGVVSRCTDVASGYRVEIELNSH